MAEEPSGGGSSPSPAGAAPPPASPPSPAAEPKPAAPGKPEASPDAPREKGSDADKDAGAAPPDPAEKAEGLIAGKAPPPGESRDDAEQRREARSEWRHAGGGDNVAGDKNINYFTVAGLHNTRIRLHAVADEERERAEFFFVISPGAERVAAAVRQFPVTVVRGLPGSGRTTAALRALAASDPQKIHNLEPRTRLSDVSVSQLPDHCRALLLSEEADERPAPPPTRFDLDELAAELLEREMQLVMSVNVAARLPAYGSLVAVVDFGDPPAAVDVLAANLRFQLGPDFDSRGPELLEHPELPALLERYLGPGSRLAKAHELAECLVRCPQGTPSLLVVVGQQMDARGEDDLANWFAELPDMRTRCMAIALAVLERQAHETVSDAAADLLRELDPRGVDRERRERPADPFGLSRRDELQLLGARSEVAEQWTRFGTIDLEVVRYHRERFGPRLFLHVWDEYRSIRRPLITWLESLGSYAAAGIRERAATAVGTLAGQVLDHIYRVLLYEWASSDNRYQQQAAATALVIAGQEPRMRPVVRALVSEWEKDDNLHRRCTAIRVYGVGVARDRSSEGGGQRSLVDDDEALPALTRVTAAAGRKPPEELDETFAVLNVVARSMSDLIMEDSRRFFGPVVDLLYDWGILNEDGLNFAARFIFLVMARDVVTEVDGCDRPWPTMLRLTMADEDRRYKVTWLWWSALTTNVWKPARWVLGQWAEKCNGDEAARLEMKQLLFDVVSGDDADRRIRGALAKSAKEWAGKDGLAVELGTWVQEELLK